MLVLFRNLFEQDSTAAFGPLTDEIRRNVASVA